MFANNNNGYSLSDLAAVTGNGSRSNGMFGDEGGAWWIIICSCFASPVGAVMVAYLAVAVVLLVLESLTAIF